jgi:hypothetical protein
MTWSWGIWFSAGRSRALGRSLLLALALLPSSADAQRLDVAGTVVCLSERSSVALADDVLVVYAADPKVRATSSPGSGKFRLIFYKPRKIRGKNLTLEFWPNETKETHTWFVPYHPTHVLDGYPAFIVPEDVLLDAQCDAIVAVDAMEAAEAENLQPASFGSHILQLLALIGSVGAAAAPVEEIIEVRIEHLPILEATPGNESGPLHLATTVDFPFLGFRYAPRTYAAAALPTNAAAVAMGDGLEIQTNGALRAIQPYRFSLGAGWADGDRFGIGFGYAVQFNSMDTTVRYGVEETRPRQISSNSHAFLLVPSWQVVPGVSIGLGPTLRLQYFEEPFAVRRETTTYALRLGGETLSTRTEVSDEVQVRWRRHARVDATASAIFDIHPNVRIGAGVQNIFGTDERVAGQTQSERVLGAGFSAVYYRLQVGSDLQYSQIRGLDGSAGLSFFADNALEVGIGYTTEGGLYRAWSRLFGSLMVAVGRNQREHWSVNLGGRVTF